MAYLPRRNGSATAALRSIRSQVDRVRWFVGSNELGDANKFRGVVGEEGYMFTIDDDLLYPEDYVERMIEKIEAYDRKAVITAHGKVIRRQPIQSFYGGDFIKYRCLDKVATDTPVHIPGTGCMGWHSDTIGFQMEDFPAPNMADIWAGIKCEREGVPRTCITHKAGWLQNINDDPETCYENNRSRDDVLTEAINSIEWSQV